jgi:hypothetical protein
MSNDNCGNCNFQGAKITPEKKIYCFYWQEEHALSYHCEKWQRFYEQNREIRQRLAEEKKRRDEVEEQKKGIRPLSNSLFENVLLEKEQKELLCTIVEAARNVPPDKRKEFLAVRSRGGSYLIHPSLPEGEIEFYSPDLQTLIGEGLIQVTGFNQQGEVSIFDILPKGFLYYKYLKEQIGEPVEQIEEIVRSYIDAHTFQKEFPKAYEKWAEAESLLWETETSMQLTKIGHLCREAIQEFMDVLYTQVDPPGEHIPKTKTKNRLSKIIEVKSEQFGKTKKEFLGVLYNYWDVVNALVQKEEHGAQKEKIQLVWEDGRRVVFQTMVLMYEVSQSLR